MNALTSGLTAKVVAHDFVCPILTGARHEKQEECIGLDCAWFVESKNCCAIAWMRKDLEAMRLQIVDSGI